MSVMQEIIHKDQTGFIHGRQMKSNVRQIVNLIEYLSKNKHIPAILIFLDAEKAFDRLNWNFLIKTIDLMCFGENFIHAIKAIYQQQSAQIVINGELTDSFNIERGTRQGCPLSPLLFILTLEILLNRIRESKELMGIKIGGFEYRTRAFADDLVVTLTQPIKSVMALKEIINCYGQVSGFKINVGKTKTICKNMSEKQILEVNNVSGFERVNKVKYLGINIMTSNKDLFRYNYVILWQKVKEDLEKWKKLQLSILGRIAAIKMNVLPKFLFLFQMLPILKRDASAKEWQQGINKFVWAGKKPRVKQKIMQDTRERGGLKMPNIRLYYEAAALSAISEWFEITDRCLLNVEGFDMNFGWHAYVIYGKETDNTFRCHILRQAMLRVWKKYCYKIREKIPIWSIPGHVFEYPRQGVRYVNLTYKELLNIENGVLNFKTLQQLKAENIDITWLQYNQLQAKWKQDCKVGISIVDDILVKNIRDQSRMHIKRLYNVLLELDSETELVKDCMIKWGQNFEEPVMLDTWERIWVRNVKFTQAQNLRENFYKMFYRWHLDPKKLSIMYPSLKPKCWRCECEDATYFHVWWTCKKIKAFWIKIWWIMQNIFKKKIKFTPQFFLLGIIMDYNNTEVKLMLNLITAARLLVGQYWKREDVPTIEEWTLKVMNLAEMAKISAYLKDNSNERYRSDWSRWIAYIQGKYQMKKLQLIFE